MPSGGHFSIAAETTRQQEHEMATAEVIVNLIGLYGRSDTWGRFNGTAFKRLQQFVFCLIAFFYASIPQWTCPRYYTALLNTIEI